MQPRVWFEWTENKKPYARKAIIVSGKNARDKAIALAEDVMLDIIYDVCYAILHTDKKSEVKSLDYFNDIL